MDITLYYAPTTCALVTYVNMTEAGVDFAVERVDLRRQQHLSDEYLAINPKHKVPVLSVDGKVLTENVAMAYFLSRQFPEAKLLPTDPWEEVKAISLMSWCASGIHPHLSRTNSPIKFCDFPGSEERTRELAKGFLFENYEVADDLLAGREFFFDHYTAVDAHFFWCYRRGTQFGHDLNGFKNCTAHFERMQQRDSVKKVLAFEKEVMEGFKAAA